MELRIKEQKLYFFDSTKMNIKYEEINQNEYFTVKGIKSGNYQTFQFKRIHDPNTIVVSRFLGENDTPITIDKFDTSDAYITIATLNKSSNNIYKVIPVKPTKPNSIEPTVKQTKIPSIDYKFVNFGLYLQVNPGTILTLKHNDVSTNIITGKVIDHGGGGDGRGSFVVLNVNGSTTQINLTDFKIIEATLMPLVVDDTKPPGFDTASELYRNTMSQEGRPGWGGKRRTTRKNKRMSRRK